MGHRTNAGIEARCAQQTAEADIHSFPGDGMSTEVAVAVDLNCPGLQTREVATLEVLPRRVPPDDCSSIIGYVTDEPELRSPTAIERGAMEA